jgi:undecaprenyl-diphosphatase
MADVCTGGIDTGFAQLDMTQAAILGVVQGITELLPISSTAHMRLVPLLSGWPDPGSAFSAAMQLAALFAVITYFRRDIIDLTTGSLTAIARGNFRNHSLRTSIGILLATLPIGVAGLLMSSWLNACGTSLRAPWVIGAASLGMALLLGLTELVSTHRRTSEHVTLLDCIIIGIAQVGALIPGVSRSGSTLTAGLLIGFKREDAARLSFLIGLPAITLAGLKEIWVLSHAGLSMQAWEILGVGLLAGSLSAFAAVWGLLHYFEKMSAWPFVIYRAAMGLLLLYIAL